MSRLTHFIIFTLFWIILSQKADVAHIVTAALVAAGIMIFNRGLLLERKEGYAFSLKRLKTMAVYTINMVVEIIKANIHVALIVLNPKLPISPGVVSYRTPLKKTVSRVLLGNSITLTPGTLTLDIEKDGVMMVHALTRDAAEGLIGWSIERLIKQLEDDIN